MQIVNLEKVCISDKPNNSYLVVPQIVMNKFVEDKQDVYLIILPFRYTKLLKCLGVSKDDFAEQFIKSGIYCKFMTSSAFLHLIEVTIPSLYPNSGLERERALSLICSNATTSRNGKFYISFSHKDEFKDKEYSVVLQENNNEMLAEIIDNENVEKLKSLISNCSISNRISV